MRTNWSAHILMLTTFLNLSIPTLANDSSGIDLPAGGLKLIKSEQIAMMEENLYLSLDEVRVDCVFENLSQTDITTTVVFPLPDVELKDFNPENDSEIGSNALLFNDFKLRVDGSSVAYRTETKANYKGKDVTSELQKWNISATGSNFLRHLQPYGVSEAARADLRRQGLLDENLWPQWSLRASYYWTQTFPVHHRLMVQHRYSPMVASSVAFPNEDPSPIDKTLSTYCTSGAALTSMAKLENRKWSYFEAEYGYILKTGANWAGPIRSFDVTIPISNDVHVFTCFKPLRDDGKGNLKGHLDNFVPKEDISLLSLSFLKPVNSQ